MEEKRVDEEPRCACGQLKVCPCGEPGETLQKDFQSKLPDLKVFCQVAPAWGWCRFYFEKGNKNHHILDVHKEALDDLKPEGVIERLEQNRWKEVLDVNQGRYIARFTKNGFENFLPWPQ